MKSTGVAVGVALTLACAVVWLISTSLRWSAWRGARTPGLAAEERSDAVLAAASVRQHLHAAVMYCVLCLSIICWAYAPTFLPWATTLLVIPMALTALQALRMRRDASVFQQRVNLEQLAQEVIAQNQDGPQRWANRLVPDALAQVDGLELGHASRAGAGLVTGDFVDVVRLDASRTALVIGDAMGHGLEPALSAVQAKDVLRTFLARFRDPGQALQEMNQYMLGAGFQDQDELLSLAVLVVDGGEPAVRYASAGHPTLWVLHQREPVALRSTGPLLMLDPQASYSSREVAFVRDDVLVLYTDGLTEARRGETEWGEVGLVGVLRREASASAGVIAKSLLDAAASFSSGALGDDATTLVVRRL